MNIADTISALPFAIVTGLFYSLFVTRNLDALFQLVTLSVGFVIERTMKGIRYPKGFSPLTKRPKGAFNCDTFSRTGPRGGKPGFPSGHTITATIFSMWQILNAWNRQNRNVTQTIQEELPVLLLSFGLIIATMWARIAKRCHTSFQVTAGLLIGILVSAVGWNMVHN